MEIANRFRHTFYVYVMNLLLGVIAVLLSGSIFDFFLVFVLVIVLFDYSAKLSQLKRGQRAAEADLSRPSPFARAYFTVTDLARLRG